jgi:hypothetical protein
MDESFFTFFSFLRSFLRAQEGRNFDFQFFSEKTQVPKYDHIWILKISHTLRPGFSQIKIENQNSGLLVPSEMILRKKRKWKKIHPSIQFPRKSEGKSGFFRFYENSLTLSAGLDWTDFPEQFFNTFICSRMMLTMIENSFQHSPLVFISTVV